MRLSGTEKLQEKSVGSRVDQLNLKTISPLSTRGDIVFKRDDYYTPFGQGAVNGGKLRQCNSLISSIYYDKEVKGIISGCSVHSPQSAIVAASANFLNLPCIILFGGTTREKLLTYPNVKTAMRYGARIKIVNSGRHSVLFFYANKMAKENSHFVVDYGMNAKKHIGAFYKTNARQVKNIPDELDNLVVTCGSGITSTGIIYGIKRYKKRLKNLFLIGVAPNRERKIFESLRLIERETGETGLTDFGFSLNYINLFEKPGFKYEQRQTTHIHGIKLHPNYEGKSFLWAHKNINFKKQKTCFWIIGAEPTIYK